MIIFKKNILNFSVILTIINKFKHPYKIFFNKNNGKEIPKAKNKTCKYSHRRQ